MSVYPADFGLSPIACAEDCAAECRHLQVVGPVFWPWEARQAEAFNACLNTCQSGCPGGAPQYIPGICQGDMACAWGFPGVVIATAGGVVSDVAAIATPGTLPNVLALGALLVAGYLFFRAAVA